MEQQAVGNLFVDCQGLSPVAPTSISPLHELPHQNSAPARAAEANVNVL